MTIPEPTVIETSTADSIAGATLADRLSHPENRVWLTSAALVLAVLGASGAILVAASGRDRTWGGAAAPGSQRIAGIERIAGGTPPALRATGLTIVDEQGNDRIIFAIDDKGAATITINDAAGQNVFHAP